MKVIAIAAVSKNGVIGKGNELPWHIPEDMKFFRDSTKNQIVIMGRKTFESLGNPLPNRENVVITRNGSWKSEKAQIRNVLVFTELKASLDYFKGLKSQYSGKDIFIIGGAEIYTLSLDWIDELWLTEIDEIIEGDVVFPLYSEGKFQDHRFYLEGSVSQMDHQSKFHYRFNRYRRKKDIK